MNVKKWVNRSSTLCKSGSNSVTWAIPIDRRPATQVYHLVQAELSAVDRGSLRFQGNDQLLGIFRRCHSCLWERIDQRNGVGNTASDQAFPQLAVSARSALRVQRVKKLLPFAKGLGLGILLPTMYSTTSQAGTGKYACSYHATGLTEQLCALRVEKGRKTFWNLWWMA